MIFDPTRAQMNEVESLALRNQVIRAEPITEEGGNLLVQVTGPPEPMGYTTRAPRVYELTIAADGRVLMGVIA